MSKGATLARQFSLGLRPRPLPELLAAGRTLQVDLSAYPELTWMIDLVLCNDYIPIGWEQAMHGPYMHAARARMHAARMHAFSPAGSSTALSAPLSAPLSLHHRTTAPPFRACRTRPTLSPSCSQAEASWLAGSDPDEDASLDLLPPEWRWQSGGAQHGAGSGAVRAALLQRLPVTHSGCQLTPPSPLRPMRPAPSHLGRAASLQRLPPPHYHPTHPRARHTKRTRPNGPSRFASARSASATSTASRGCTPTSTPCLATCAPPGSSVCPRRRCAVSTDSRVRIVPIVECARQPERGGTHAWKRRASLRLCPDR